MSNRHRQVQCGWVPVVMEDLLLHFPAWDARSLFGAIGHIPGMRAGADEQTNLLPCLPALGCASQVNDHLADSILQMLPFSHDCPQVAVRNVCNILRDHSHLLADHTEPDEEIWLLLVRAEVQRELHVPNDLHILRQSRRGEGHYIRALLVIVQFAATSESEVELVAPNTWRGFVLVIDECCRHLGDKTGLWLKGIGREVARGHRRRWRPAAELLPGVAAHDVDFHW
mmetsp:Transcript_49162/g.87746  ORF Transcript_49162/g.87746 Transcript_49162/m.87746 type:complete len:227 (-) Transcript_49162:1402-2082(-)